MRNASVAVLASVWLALTGIIAGCHADPDDAAGQAGELSDPVRRQNAIANIQRLYSGAMAETENDRDSEQVKAIVDATIEKLTQAYIEHEEDVRNGQAILNLLREMQDPRAIPAFKKAMGWRAEVTEEHAITAAQALRQIEVPEGEKGEVIEKLSDALDRVSGARGVDNRMRIEFIRTLGSFDDERALPILTKVATSQSEEQAFQINILAAQQVGRIGSDESIAPMINALFLFDANAPQMRMNDVAAEALVRIGQSSYQPLIELLEGNNEEANAIVESYIAAVRERDEAAAEAMSVEMLVNAEATFALGALGNARALDPILAEVNQEEDVNRRINASIALVRLNLEAGQMDQVRTALKNVYEAAPLQAKPQLLAAMRHLYDGALLPFFLEQGADTELHPDVRIHAVKSYALLANGDEVGALRQLIEREDPSEEGGYKENFAQNDPLLAMATECDEDLSCWIGKVGDSDKEKVVKATYMIARYGRGNAEAIAALTGLLDHVEVEVRLAAVQSLDHIATDGAPEAVAKIDELREEEEGRSVWNTFKREALPIQARLRSRGN